MKSDPNNNKKLKIAELTPESAAALHATFRNSSLYKYAINKSVKPFDSTTTSSCHYSIYQDDYNKPIGYMQGYYPDEIGSFWIQTFIIDEAHTRKGYGTEFYRMLMEHLQENNPLTKVYLACYDANTRGCLFWESLGFKPRTTTTKKVFNNETNNIVIYQWNRS